MRGTDSGRWAVRGRPGKKPIDIQFCTYLIIVIILRWIKLLPPGQGRFLHETLSFILSFSLLISYSSRRRASALVLNLFLLPLPLSLLQTPSSFSFRPAQVVKLDFGIGRIGRIAGQRKRPRRQPLPTGSAASRGRKGKGNASFGYQPSFAITGHGRTRHTRPNVNDKRFRVQSLIPFRLSDIVGIFGLVSAQIDSVFRRIVIIHFRQVGSGKPN